MPKPKRVCAFPGCSFHKKGTVLPCCVACQTDMHEAFDEDLNQTLFVILKNYGVPDPGAIVTHVQVMVIQQQKKWKRENA